MRIRLSSPWMHSLSGLFVNLSAAWFAAAFLTPAYLSHPVWPFLLTGNLISGIVFLLASVKLEELLNV